MGRDIEATALSHAAKLHAKMRVLLNGQRTVVLRASNSCTASLMG